jgi:outer membrane protein insertion porin family
VVGRIVVEGAERIEPATIISYLPIAVGDTVDAARIDLSLKTLFRTDLFSDAQIELQGDTLLVRVVENPIINQVVFEGNSSLKDDKIRDEVTIHPRGIFTRAAVQADVQRIVELYRRSGRISATVTPEIVELPQKRVDLIFKIVEGSKTGIDRVNFIGNRAFSDNTLRDTIVTTESHWYKFFTSNDNYDPDRIEFDREQLRKYYINKGYYDFRVISSIAELSPDQKRFSVTYTIEEGPKYKFGKLEVTTDLKRLNGQVLKNLLPIKSGQLYQGDKIESAVDSLTFAAGSQGFAFVDVRPRYTPNRENNTIDVVFDVREGPRVYVERIDIVGNTRTLDPVVRQQLRIAEGDAYNRVLVDRSRLEVRRLDFFKTVDIEQLPGSAPDKTILRVKVEEQPTGELSFGAGYSSVDKLLLDVGISERNFRGRGQDVRLRASVGSLRQQIDFSFTEPRFLGRDLRAGFDLYDYKYDYSNYSGFTTKTLGSGLRLGFPLNVTTYFTARYQLKTDDVTVQSGACEAGTISATICEQRGSALTSQLGYSASYDKRNDPIRATRGFLVTLSQDLAGIGGDVNFIRTEGAASWYHGFTPNVILRVDATAGYITPWGGDTIRINDRFYKGGSTFRGFETAGIGPRDTLYSESLGGKLYGIGTVELAFPNKLPEQYGIKTSLFSDFGTLGKLDKSVASRPNVVDNLGLRASAGLSVFWTSPLGPIRLDFSKVLKKESYDRTETFRFSTATQF